MSKTIGSILSTIGQAAALVVAPYAYLIADKFVGKSSAISTASIAGYLGLGGSESKAEAAVTAIKTERPPAVSQYGRGKLFGAYICYETSSGGTAVDVYVFHEGQIDGIEEWYLGDKKVTRLSNGFVQEGPDGAYGTGVIQIGANLGLPIETAHAPVIAKLPGKWTTDHRGDGVVTGYMLSNPVKAKDYQKIYPAGGPDRTPLAIVFRGQLVYDWRDSTQSLTDPRTWKWSENSWLHIAHYKLVREAVGPTRPPSDPAYWTDIAALYGARWARLFAPSLVFWTTAANDADTAVPLKAGGSEPRYRSCVSHKHAGDGSEHKAVLAALLSTCDGWVAARQDGALIARAGRYYTPTVTIGPDQIVGYTVEAGVEDENALNQINVSYVSALHDFNVVETDPWVDEDDILQRGAVRSTDFAPQTPSHAQNRRLAKRKMAQTMAPKRGTFTLLSTGAAVLGERFVYALFAEGVGTEDEFIAYDGPIEITQLSRNLRTGIISATWIAADVNIDAWNPATEEGDPAPVGDRVAREPLVAPMIVSASAQYSAVGQDPNQQNPGAEPTDGAVASGARVLIAATGPDREDLQWSARWRVGTSGSWNEREYADADPGPGVSFLTEFVPLAANINVEVAYTVGDGRLSPWSDPVAVDTTQQDAAIMRVTENGDSRITEAGNRRVGE